MFFWNNSYSALILIIILLSYFAILHLIGIKNKIYNPLKEFICVLGGNKNHSSFLFDFYIIIFGLIICIFATNFYIIHNYTSKLLSILGYSVIFSFGVNSCIISGIFHYNQKNPFSSLYSAIHSIFAGIGIVSFTFVPLIISLFYFKINLYLYGMYSIIIFTISLLLLIIIFLRQMNILIDTFFSYIGLWQTLLIMCSYTSILMFSISTIYY